MNEQIYVVQGSSGIIFTVTTDYEKAKIMKDAVNKEATLQTWVSGKILFEEY